MAAEIFDDVLLNLSATLKQDELLEAVGSSISLLVKATPFVFVRPFENGEDFEAILAPDAPPVRLPRAGIARQCQWTGERVERDAAELKDANDPLVDLLRGRIDGSVATERVLCMPVSTGDGAASTGNSVFLIVILVCPQPLDTEEERVLSLFLKHVKVAAGRVCKHRGLIAERDRLDGMLSMCSELIDQNSAMLTTKILGHLKHETECKCCTMLMVDGLENELVCQVFNLEELSKEMRFSLDDTLFGYVAKTGSCVNIQDVSKDLRFDPLKDQIGTYQPESLLCMPVFSKVYPNEILAVAVIYDKIGRRKFTKSDEEKMQFVLRFCSSVLHNTLMFQKERNLKVQTQALLDIAEVLFTNVDSMDVLLQKIMEEARKLTSAERCSLFLVDYETQELVAKIFDSSLPKNGGTDREIRFPQSQGIAGYVAMTGEVVNIKDAYSHELFYKDVDMETGFRTRSILCFPIKNEENMIIGVAELCNKLGASYFSMEDETLALQFSAYCAISIHQSMLYKGVVDAQNRSQLANELMLYHMQVDEKDVQAVCESTFEAGPDLPRCSFLPRSIPTKDSPVVCMTMFQDMGLIKRWRIPTDVLAKFILMVSKGYRTPIYHNWTHAFSVAHFCFAMFKSCDDLAVLQDLEIFSLIVATLCHDLDHRGTNNAYQVSSHSVLASLYSSEGSVMEHHHFAQALCILNSPGCNILENLTQQQYTDVLDLIRDNILATDLSHHLRIVKHLQGMADAGYDPHDANHHHLLLCLLMTSCDLCACTKTWKSSQAVAELIYAEFFSQGDLERAVGVQPMEMMDRERACISELQLNFLDFIAIPVYRLLGQVFPQTADVYGRVLESREEWRKQTEQMKKEKALNFLNARAEEVERLRRQSIKRRERELMACSGGALRHVDSIPDSLPDLNEKDRSTVRKISSASDPGPVIQRGGGLPVLNGMAKLSPSEMPKRTPSMEGEIGGSWRQCGTPTNARLSTGSDSSETSRHLVVETS